MRAHNPQNSHAKGTVIYTAVGRDSVGLRDTGGSIDVIVSIVAVRGTSVSGRCVTSSMATVQVIVATVIDKYYLKSIRLKHFAVR